MTLLTAGAVCLAVVGTGWTLQTAILPKPAEAKVIATQAMAWVSGNRPIASTFTIGSAKPVHATCVSGRLRFKDGNTETTALLTEGGVESVFPVGYPFRRADGVHVGPPPASLVVRLALAGCPPVLESLIGGLLKFPSQPPHAGYGTMNGRAVRTLTIGTKAGRVTIYLDAASKAPLVVEVSGPKLTGRAQLTIGPAS